MGTIFTIAWRNIFRHKGRTIRSAITIGVGLLFFLAMDSLMAGMDRSAIDNLINLSSSAIRIQTQEYAQENGSFPLKHGIEKPGSLARFVRELPGVRATTTRTPFMGQLSNYEQMLPVAGTVVEAATDTAVFTLTRHLSGDWFSSESTGEIILGYKLAEEFGLEVGDYVTLYALTRYESRNADEFVVVGLLETTDPSINKNSALITYQAATELLDLEGLRTELDVAVDRKVNVSSMIDQVEGIAAQIEEGYPKLKAQTFMEIGADFLEISKQKRSFGLLFLVAILLIAALGIFNTVLMSVYERVREVGVLRAHGFRPGEISWMFLMEGLFTGLAGSVLGISLALPTIWLLVNVGYPLDYFGDIDTTGMAVWGTLYGEWNIVAMIFAFVFGIAVAILAGLIPSRKAGKLEITRALRFV